MKLITIMQDVSYGNMPKFKKGQEVNVSERVAKDLIDRGNARAVTGDSREKVKKAKDKKGKEQGIKTPDVTVTRKKGDKPLSVTTHNNG